MKKIVFFFTCIAFFVFILFIFNRNKNMDIIYTYADGTGNQYIVAPDTFEYIPVPKDVSSSGVYSGGESKKGSVTVGQYEVVQKAFDSAFADTASHIENREMLSGYIERVEGSEKKSAVLGANSDTKSQIENVLKGLPL